MARHQKLGEFVLTPIDTDGLEQVLFTENDSNLSLLDPNYNGSPVFSKDAFDRFIVNGQVDAVRKDRTGTKCGLLYRLHVQPGESRSVRFRLVRRNQAAIGPLPSASQADATIQTRADEADEFYKVRLPDEIAPEERRVARQAYAGLLWSKQFYYFVADKWLSGDHTQVRPPVGRGREEEHWKNLFCRDVLSMPDKWEYPWFAAWDLAFHMLPMAELDPQFAKDQLLLLLREWYMHPSGQLPAYEFAFSDVNPPVHAWAVWHVYRMGVAENGQGDLLFLERAFQKLMLNFTWWVNRNDAEGQNLFGGGFLGLDNIGVFDRSEELPNGACPIQADGTAWMGLFCAAMLQIALELAYQRSEAYEDIASKFFEHYIAIIDAMNAGSGLWDEEEGFYFDQIKVAGEPSRPLHIKSMVGLIPLFAVCILKRDTIANLSGFKQRLKWFMENKPELSRHVRVSKSENEEIKDSYWISIVPDDRLSRILTCVLDQERFFSPFGIRSLSREHFEKPFTVDLNGKTLSARYTPAEGDTGLFGGNSNWRGPVWFPVNMLLINALERYYLVYGESFRVECSTHSGNWVSLVENAEYLSYRLACLFLPNEEGRRPCHGTEDRYARDPHWRELVLFNEYFSGDDGRGIGASHQTGWTALVATLIRTRHMRRDARNRAQ